MIGTLSCACIFTGGAGALSTSRQYEMVSPLYKGGYGAQEITAVSSDGERVAYFSLGGFAGTLGGPVFADYMAQRRASGWSTVSLLPPAAMTASEQNFDFSPTLESKLVQGIPGPNFGSSQVEGARQKEYLIHNTSQPDAESYWELAGGILEQADGKPFGIEYKYVGASADLCHIFFSDENAVLPVIQKSNGEQLYDLSRGCEEEPTLRLVGVDNSSSGERPVDQSCGIELGIGTVGGTYKSHGKGSLFNAIAQGGALVFFTSGVEEAEGSCSAHHQLFARLGGTRTIEVSRQSGFGGCSEVPCAGAAERASSSFAGASEDGGIAYFTSAESVAGPENLYVARIGCVQASSMCAVSERELLSVDRVSTSVNTSEAADVQGVVRVAPDGERVYYVASGVMSGEPNDEGQIPISGADNLYVYDLETGTTRFIGELCSGPEHSGTDRPAGVEDTHCPASLNEVTAAAGSSHVNDSDLWEAGGTLESQSQVGGVDGRYLVFSSYGRLTIDDVSSARNVYRYDSVTGELERVSIGEEGADDNGNYGAQDATIAFGSPGGPVFEQYEMARRAISEDGSRIVFRTSRPLSEGASNGLVNVYEWRKEAGWSRGRVSLVSCGCSLEEDKQVVISPSGEDVFFTTAAGLTPRDTDDAVDVYDAHECSEGAPCFGPPIAETESCEGEGCYGPLTNPVPLLVPDSAIQSPPESIQQPKVAPKKTKKAKRTKKKKRDKKGAGKSKRKSQNSEKADRKLRVEHENVTIYF